MSGPAAGHFFLLSVISHILDRSISFSDFSFCLNSVSSKIFTMAAHGTAWLVLFLILAASALILKMIQEMMLQG